MDKLTFHPKEYMHPDYEEYFDANDSATIHITSIQKASKEGNYIYSYNVLFHDTIYPCTIEINKRNLDVIVDIMSIYGACKIQDQYILEQEKKMTELLDDIYLRE